MSRPRKYPEELIQRGVGFAIESGRPVAHVAKDLGLYHRRRCASGSVRLRLTMVCDRICRPERRRRR